MFHEKPAPELVKISVCLFKGLIGGIRTLLSIIIEIYEFKRLARKSMPAMNKIMEIDKWEPCRY